MYIISYARSAVVDSKKLSHLSYLKDKVEELLKIIKIDPFKIPPPYKKLSGDLSGCISRRLNDKHRLVYEVYKKEKAVKILRIWGHYDD